MTETIIDSYASHLQMKWKRDFYIAVALEGSLSGNRFVLLLITDLQDSKQVWATSSLELTPQKNQQWGGPGNTVLCTTWQKDSPLAFWLDVLQQQGVKQSPLLSYYIFSCCSYIILVQLPNAWWWHRCRVAGCEVYILIRTGFVFLLESGVASSICYVR